MNGTIVVILSSQPDRSEQTVKTKVKIVSKLKSDHDLHCLLYDSEY